MLARVLSLNCVQVFDEYYIGEVYRERIASSRSLIDNDGNLRITRPICIMF